MIHHLLDASPSRRLGMRNGQRDITGHPFCKMGPGDVDKLLKKETRPPFVPKLKDPCDTSNFDEYPSDAGSEQASKKYDRFLDRKYDATWAQEFGEPVDKRK